MSFHTLTRGLALLMLLVSMNAWSALTQQEVLMAIQTKASDAPNKVALYAASLNTSVAEAVRKLVTASPHLAGHITAAAVKANPSKAGDIVSAAMQALENNPRVKPADIPKLQADIIKNAVANARGREQDIRAAAAQAGVPPDAIDAAVAAGLAVIRPGESPIANFVGDVSSGGIASP